MNYNNNSRDNAPTRGALVDPQTYGMLLWQSKLQTKLLQEVKKSFEKNVYFSIQIRFLTIKVCKFSFYIKRVEMKTHFRFSFSSKSIFIM